MKNALSIVIFSVDVYADVWDPLFDIFEMYWKNCPFSIYLINNELKYDRKGITVINCGNDKKWIERGFYAINQLDDEYLLIFQEDYFIGEEVDDDIIDQLNNIVNFMKQENIYFYKFKDVPSTNIYYKGDKNLGCITSSLRYGMNFQIGIWKREKILYYLKDMLSCGYQDAWGFEIYFLDRLDDKNEIIDGVVSDKRDLLKIQPAIDKGKWKRDVLKYFKKRGYNISIEKRDVLPYKDTFKLKITQVIKNGTSVKTQKRIKNIAKKLGIKFFINS